MIMNVIRLFAISLALCVASNRAAADLRLVLERTAGAASHFAG
jgi:hypothetical protein